MTRALLVLLLFAGSALGELAPEVYAQMRRDAPEVLQVQVTKADVQRTSAWREGCAPLERELTSRVTLTARVLGVVRTASGARAGQVVTIEYSSLKPCSGWSGPRPIPILKKDDRVFAWLSKSDRVFAPAARGASFSSRRE